MHSQLPRFLVFIFFKVSISQSIFGRSAIFCYQKRDHVCLVRKSYCEWNIGLLQAYHTLARQCQNVLRTTTQVNGKVGNSTPAPSKTPEPIITYICMGDYVYLPLRKIHHDTITPCRLPPNMRICALSDSASFLVLPSAYSQDLCTDFHDQYVKWRRFAQGCAFWGPENKILHFDPIFPQIAYANFWQIFDETHFAS